MSTIQAGSDVVIVSLFDQLLCLLVDTSQSKENIAVFFESITDTTKRHNLIFQMLGTLSKLKTVLFEEQFESQHVDKQHQQLIRRLDDAIDSLLTYGSHLTGWFDRILVVHVLSVVERLRAMQATTVCEEVALALHVLLLPSRPVDCRLSVAFACLCKVSQQQSTAIIENLMQVMLHHDGTPFSIDRAVRECVRRDNIGLLQLFTNSVHRQQPTQSLYALYILACRHHARTCARWLLQQKVPPYDAVQVQNMIDLAESRGMSSIVSALISEFTMLYGRDWKQPLKTSYTKKEALLQHAWLTRELECVKNHLQAYVRLWKDLEFRDCTMFQMLVFYIRQHMNISALLSSSCTFQ